MTKKGKRTALPQRAGEISELQAENEQLRARLAEYEKGPGPSRLCGLLADNASDVIWLADMDLNLTYVSPSAARMLGCRPEEVLTPAVKDMLLPEPVRRQIADCRERMAPDGGAAFHGRRGMTLETRLNLGDGSDIWVEDSIDFVRGEAGRLTGVMGIVRDVTGRKQAEEELRLSGERSRLLLENASEGIAVVQDGVLRLANPRLAQMSGYTMEELISRSFLEVVHPDDRERVAGHYARWIEGEEPSQSYLSRFVDKAGRTRWGETNVARIEWEGKPAILAVVGDVSERMAAQQALEESERLYRLLADNSSDVIWTSDLDIRITYVSPSVTRVLGYSPDEIKAMSFERWFLPSSLDLVARIHTQDLSAESRQPGSMAERVVDVEMLTSEGSLVWVEAAIKGIRDAEGRLVGFQGACREITQRKKAQEAMAASEERFRTIFEQAPIGAVVYDSRGAPLQANEASVGIFGVSSDGALGGPSLFDYHGLTDEEKRRLRAGETVSGEALVDLDVDRALGLYSTAMSGKVYVRITAAPLGLQEDGSARGYLALVEDVTKRKQVEEALQRQESFFRAVTENSTDGILVADREGNIKYESPGARRLLGLSRDRTGESVTGPIHPDDLPAAAEVLNQVLSGQPARVEMRARHADGSWRTIDSTLVNLLDDPGVEGIVVNMRDVTERKRAEEALRASEERNRLLVDNANEAIAVVQDQVVKFANQKTLEMGGYTMEEIVSVPFLEMVHPDDRQRVAEHHLRRMRGEEVPSSYELRTLTRDGDIRWAELKAAALEWEGRPATLALMHDITDRRKAEESLRESEERYRMLAENASDVIWTMDMNMTYTYNSPSKLRQSGYTPEEFQGLSAAQVLTPESLQHAVRVFQEEMALEQVPDKDVHRTRVLEMAEYRKDGSLLWTEATASFLRDKNGQAIGVIGISRDITERKRAEEALRESEARLRREEHLFRMLTESSSDVVVLINPDGTIRYESPAVGRVLGFKPEERVGGSVFENLHPDEGLAVAETFARMKADPRSPPERHEIHLRHRDGSWRTLESLACLIVHDSVVEGVMVNLRDITDRKTAEEALRGAKEYAEYVIRTANVLVVVLDMEGKATLLNEAGEKITGYSQAEVTGKDWFELVVPKERYPWVWEGFDSVKAGGTIADTFENPILTRSGEERIISWKNSVLVRNGETAGTLSFGIDVTERRRAEEGLLKAHAELEARVEQRTAELKAANERLVEEVRQRQRAQGRLQESEARYRGLVESANSIIMELDTRGKVTFFNRFAREFYGFKESEIIGRQMVGTVAPPVDSAGNDLKARLRDLVKHPEEYLATEGEGMLRNGDRVWISWTNKGLYDSRGRLRNLLCIGMDRTEQRRTAEMLAEQAKEKAAAEERQRLARELHDAVTQMLFSASIIAAVLPRLWAKDRAEGLRRLDELRQLTRGALAEMRLLLLELRPAALAEVGLGDLLRHLAEATSGRAGFPVSFTFEGQCTVPADVQMALYRVSQEALANAAKHSHASEAKVHLLCRRRSAVVTVADNGCGFDVKRVSPEHLGLRIMQERAEAVGAAVTVVSSKRRGTEVRAVWSKAGRKGRP